jgi:hypothetical protein
MVVLSTRYNLLHENSFEWNREVKRDGGGVVWEWVTDQKVWLRLKFDLRLSVISVKNILIEILASQTIQRFKKIELFWKNYKQHQTMPMGLRRGQCRRHRLRQGQKLRRQPNRATPRAALGIDYANDNCALRRGLSAVGVSQNSCSASVVISQSQILGFHPGEKSSLPKQCLQQTISRHN